MPGNIILLFIFLFAIYTLKRLFRGLIFEKKRKQRQEYYRNVYLKSDDWQRKRHMVLRRDNWQCVYRGGRATEVHHKKYARRNIGREPISWLVSICHECHERIHGHAGNNTRNPSNQIEFSHSKQSVFGPSSHLPEVKPDNESKNIQEWLKANPTKGINDYYITFRK